jgi:hydrogenase maturation protease
MKRTLAAISVVIATDSLMVQFSNFTPERETILCTNTDRIVVLGVGNTLLKDEGVGVRVVEEFGRQYDLPDNVRVVDGGTQGLWLTPTLQETDHLIVVDAVLGDEGPGALYRLEREDLPKGLRLKQSAHDSDLVEALNLCRLLDVGPKSVVVLGIQPQDITPFGLELTEPVAARVPDLVLRIVEELKKLGIDPEKKV